MAIIKHKAFTLIELLIVFAVIGLLAGIILASVKSFQDRAGIAKTLQYGKSVDNLLAADAVGIWNFDDQTNPTKDTSGWANHGTINGATFTTDTPHKAAGAGAGKYALSFDGMDDYVNCGNAVNLSSQNITIAFWFKPGNWTGNDWEGRIVYKQTPGGSGWGEYWVFGGRPGESIIFQRTPVDASWHSISSNKKDWNTTIWYHIVAEYGNGYWRIYIDGILDKSTYDYITVEVGNKNLYLGYNKFNNKIDEVRIFSRALTQAEIQKIYTEGLKTHSNLVSK